jgi:hypothetical protein
LAKAALYCAHRTSTVSSCAFCEQEGHLAIPSLLADFFSILLGLAGGGQSLVHFPKEASFNFRNLLRAYAEDAPTLGQFFKVGFDVESGDV